MESISWASTLIAVGSIGGSVLGGFWMARIGARKALMMPIFLLLFALVGLTLSPQLDVVLSLLLLCGIAYGALIAVVPVIVRNLHGDAAFKAVFGRMFSAWGMAGLLAPAVAGSMYDATGNYTSALEAAIALTALACALTLAKPGARWH
jgi:MFS family permease